MIQEVNLMLKKLIILNVVIGMILFGIIQATSHNKYGIYFLLGVTLAIINLIINTVVNKNVIIKNKTALFNIIGFVLRIGLVVISACLVFKNNNMINVIFLLLGYSSNFISLIIYGIGLGKNKE